MVKRKKKESLVKLLLIMVGVVFLMSSAILFFNYCSLTPLNTRVRRCTNKYLVETYGGEYEFISARINKLEDRYTWEYTVANADGEEFNTEFTYFYQAGIGKYGVFTSFSANNYEVSAEL